MDGRAEEASTRLTSGSPAWRAPISRQRVRGSRSSGITCRTRLYVSGTTATDQNGHVVAPGDAAAQTRFALERIRKALALADASLSDVVRTRICVTDIAQWEAVGRVHGEVFGDILPTATMVEVSALIDPDLVVEIEADAVVGNAPDLI